MNSPSMQTQLVVMPLPALALKAMIVHKFVCDVIRRRFSKHFYPIVLCITWQKSTPVADNKAILWKQEKLIRNTHLWFVESQNNRNE